MYCVYAKVFILQQLTINGWVIASRQEHFIQLSLRDDLSKVNQDLLLRLLVDCGPALHPECPLAASTLDREGEEIAADVVIHNLQFEIKISLFFTRSSLQYLYGVCGTIAHSIVDNGEDDITDSDHPPPAGAASDVL